LDAHDCAALHLHIYKVDFTRREHSIQFSLLFVVGVLHAQRRSQRHTTLLDFDA
jgi:hypothetical protein